MKQKSVQLSLRWKILTLMTLLLVSILSLSTYLQITHQKQFFERELNLRTQLIKEKLMSKGNTLSYKLARQVEQGLVAMTATNFSQIAATLKQSITEEKALSYAILTDHSNKAYIHTLKPELEHTVLTAPVDYHLLQQPFIAYEHTYFGFPVMEFIFSIQMKGETWGVLRLGFSLSILNEKRIKVEQDNQLTIQTMVRHSLYQLFFFIVLSASVIFILSSRLSRSLKKITEAVNQLATGDFSISNSLNIHSNDEMGILANAFVEMSNQFKTSDSILKNHHAELEQQIEKKTAGLMIAKDEKVNAYRSKADFLSIVRHEMQVPLHAVTEIIDLSLKTKLNTFQYGYLSKIKQSVDSLLMIFNDLLDLSKLEEGQLQIETIDFYLEDMLNYLKTLLAIKIEEKGLTLHFSIADNVPHFFQGDSLRLGQILHNLVSHAIECTEVGDIYVVVELASDTPEDESMERVQFSIIDHSEGLLAQKIEHLFDSPFEGGTYLKLFISQQLVELMGGTLRIESAVGVGKQFIFDLYLKSKQSLDFKQSPKIEHYSSIAIKHCKILVVDDYDINQQIAKAMLEEKGWTVYLAGSGQQAIEMIKDTPFDAVLMDLQMPNMDGFEATRLIRTEPRFADLPIIALTARLKDKEKCLQQGMTDCITKPIDMDELLAILSNYLTPSLDLNKESIKIKNRYRENIQLSGLNFSVLMQQLGGDEQVCYKILIEFKNKFTDIFQKIKNSVDKGEWQQAEQLIHGLKGVASNLAAVELINQSEILDNALTKRSLNDLTIPINQCEYALQQVLSDIKVLTTEIQGQTGINYQNKKSNIVQAGKELNKLIPLLKQSSLDADIQYDVFKACLSYSFFTVAMNRLGEYIDCFDFKKALLIAQKIAQELSLVLLDNDEIQKDMNNKFRLLIVDDMPINIKLLAQALRGQYSIQIANNGADALFIATNTPQPDLILLDIEMPGMNGYEICQKLKTNPLTKNIFIIFLTAKTEAIDETIGLELGAIDYITKPFSTSVVQVRVNAYVELKRQSDLLQQLATVDELTGIPNRRKLNEVLEAEWQRGQRAKTPLSVIFIDVDFFKHFNDFYGHFVGDQCLSIIAQTLKGSLKRKSDFVARYGGEEFIIILPNTNSQAAFILAELMRSNVENLKLPHIPTKNFTSVTLSLGLATAIPQEGIEATQLISAADSAVYQAKSKGRNQVQVQPITEYL